MALQSRALIDTLLCVKNTPVWAFNGSGDLTEYPANEFTLAYDETGNKDGFYTHEAFTNLIEVSDATLPSGYPTRGGGVSTTTGICGFNNAILVDPTASTSTSYAYRNLSFTEGNIYYIHVVMKFVHDNEPSIRATPGAFAPFDVNVGGRAAGSVLDIAYKRRLKPNHWYFILKLDMTASTTGSNYFGFALYDNNNTYLNNPVTYQIFCITQGDSFVPCFPISQGSQTAMSFSYGHNLLSEGVYEKPFILNVVATVFSVSTTSPDGVAGLATWTAYSSIGTQRCSHYYRQLSSANQIATQLLSADKNRGFTFSAPDLPLARLDASVAAYKQRHDVRWYRPDDATGGTFGNSDTGEFDAITGSTRRRFYFGVALSSSRVANAVIHAARLDFG